MAARLNTAFALGVNLLLVAAPLSARLEAEPDAGSTAPATANTSNDSRGVIELSVVGNAQTFEGLRGAIAQQSFAPATLRFLRAERFDARELIRENRESSDVLIRCWLDLSDRHHARLYFADRSAERFLIRDLELSGKLDELDREALSQALELSIRALLEDRRAGLTREEARSLLAPANRPTPPTEPSKGPEPAHGSAPSAHPSFVSGAFWQTTWHSSELGPKHEPGLLLSYEYPFAALRGSLWLSGQYQFEQSFREDRVGLSLNGVALRTGLELSRSFAGVGFVGLRLGGGLDVVRLAPARGNSEDPLVLTAPRTRSIAALSSALLVGSELSPHLRVALGLVAEFPLTHVHYDLELAGARTRVVDSWPVWPGLALFVDAH